MISIIIGLVAFGCALGLVTGLSTSEGISKKALGVLGGLGGGGLVIWFQEMKSVSIALGSVSAGFILGGILGAYLRIHVNLVEY